MPGNGMDRICGLILRDLYNSICRYPYDFLTVAGFLCLDDVGGFLLATASVVCLYVCSSHTGMFLWWILYLSFKFILFNGSGPEKTPRFTLHNIKVATENPRNPACDTSVFQCQPRENSFYSFSNSR
jgi:hypothetical protein